MKKQEPVTTKISGIYKITAPTGKVYIGQSADIKKRWHQYKKDFFKKQYKLYYSIQKYGYENHEFSIIEQCGESELNLRERFWQDFYNAVEEGLNLTLTNTEEKRKVFSQETKDKISSTQKGKTLTLEHKQKLSEARKKLPDEVSFITKRTFGNIFSGVFGVIPCARRFFITATLQLQHGLILIVH